MTDHPSAERLRLWLDGRLDKTESAEIESHLDTCHDVCSKLLDDIEHGRITTPEPTATETERVLTLPTPPGYEVIAELGRGGMGVVYKARQIKADRIVALKMILTGDGAGQKERERFRIESEAVAKLDHPNIIHIFEVNEYDNRPYFSLEYCPGGSLAKKLAGTPLPQREAATIVQQLARAMATAHKLGVIHRDLKPANVLLAEDGTAKIGDFGLAKKLDIEGGQTLTGTGDIIGTPSYMPPEQALGRSKQAGPGVDIYALGAILYELLTGRPPFLAATTLDTILQVIGTEPVPVRQVQPTVSRDLETICLKCLQKRVTSRYASAGDLADDLDRFLKGEPIKARPIRAWERSWRWAKRNPALAVSYGLIALVAALGFGGILWQYLRAESRATDLSIALGDRDRALGLSRESESKAFEFATKESNARISLEEQLYDNYIAVAEREITLNHDVSLAGTLLARCPQHLRGWEWKYLMRLRDGGGLQLGDSPAMGERPVIRGMPGGHKGVVWMATYSPDGQRLATCSMDGTVKIWDTATYKVLRTIKGNDDLLLALAPPIPVLCTAFSPDGRSIATGSFSPNIANLRASPGLVKIWDVKSGREILAFQQQVGPVLSIAYSPDGQRIASSSLNKDNTFVVWDARTKAIVKVVSGHDSNIYRLRYSSDGRFLLSGSANGTAKLWNAADLTEVHTIKAHDAHIQDVAFSHDNTRFATASMDGTVRLWDSVTGAAVLDPLRGHTGSTMGVTFSPNGKRIATAGYDKTVRLWDTANGKLKLTLRGHTDLVANVAFSPSGQQLASSSFDSTVRIWDATPRDLESKPGIFTVAGHTDRVNSVAFDSAHRYIASGGWDKTIRLWNAQTGDVVRTLEGHKGAIWCVAFSPDSKLLASASWDNTVKIWNPETGELIRTFSEHTGKVQGVAFSPDGKRVASAGMDAIVRIWDVETGKVIVRCESFLPVGPVAFSPDGKRLASGSTDHSVTMWDAMTGKRLYLLTGHAGAVPGLSFNREGTRLVTASWDYTLKIWDVDPKGDASRNRDLLTLKGHTDQVNGVAFSRDGLRIASAGEDKTVRIWDATAGKELPPHLLHRGTVWSVSFSPDGKRLATGCWDATGWLKTWDAERQSMMNLK